MKYSLGPVLYYWPKETLEDFYQQAANCSADTIYLGEAVCSKRRATKVGDWIEMAKTLAASGKQVVLSTLALVQASSELGELKRYVDNGEFLIEASDLGVVNLCAERKLPFVAGHALNCYNAVTLGIQTMSGYVYNLGNELTSMHGLVDMVRLSPMGNETFAMLEAFRANENGAAPLDLTSNSDCNGYWKRLPGLVLQA